MVAPVLRESEMYCSDSKLEIFIILFCRREILYSLWMTIEVMVR